MQISATKVRSDQDDLSLSIRPCARLFRIQLILNYCAFTLDPGVLGISGHSYIHTYIHAHSLGPTEQELEVPLLEGKPHNHEPYDVQHCF